MECDYEDDDCCLWPQGTRQEEVQEVQELEVLFKPTYLTQVSVHAPEIAILK